MICEVLIQDYCYVSIHYYHILHKHRQDVLSPCCPILFPLSPKIKAERNEDILQSRLQAIFYNSLGLKFPFIGRKVHAPCCGITLLAVHKQHCLFCIYVSYGKLMTLALLLGRLSSEHQPSGSQGPLIKSHFSFLLI